ncbi:histidine phosphatase family protein [bacterium]|nr:histidine phosphatase family protein [bacterium]
MHHSLPIILLARHGETAWSLTGQHTGCRTDLPLTERGERNARHLGQRLEGIWMPHVFCSPLLRARRTCELAGYAEEAEIDPDLVEWDYGDYEGITTPEIRKTVPDWTVFRHGAPNGESVEQATARADRVVAKLRELNDSAILFSSGHFLRLLAARWCGWLPAQGKQLLLDTATISILGYEHTLDEPAIRLWNDSRHVVD